MRRSFLNKLRCFPDCELQVAFEDGREIRQGAIVCKGVGKTYPIVDGIVHMLPTEMSEEILHEKEHAESFSYFKDGEGRSHPITRDTLARFKDLFLSLPRGDGSYHFLPGGGFHNQAGNATRFFEALEMLKLTGRESILEVGASFGWGARRFAQKGCDVVALDVTHYLMAADLFFESDGSYFERAMADMNELPFRDQVFDVIFSHSVIHHCKDLGRLFAEFRRVLKPGGRVVALHECAFGLLEDKSGKALQEAIAEGFNENAYTLPQWRKGALAGGFRKVRFHFFSLIDAYIDRKELRSSRRNWKLRFAYWLRSKNILQRIVEQLLVLPRIILRPKAWMMTASK